MILLFKTFMYLSFIEKDLEFFKIAGILFYQENHGKSELCNKKCDIGLSCFAPAGQSKVNELVIDWKYTMLNS